MQVHAGIAQLVERNLAKVEVASSRLVSRSRSSKGSPGFPFLSGFGAVAKRLCTGLQIRVGRFDSGPRLHINQSVSPPCGGFFSVVVGLVLHLSFKVNRWHPYVNTATNGRLVSSGVTSPRRVRALVQRGSSLPNRWTAELPSHGFWQPLRKRSFHPCIPRYRARGAYGD